MWSEERHRLIAPVVDYTRPTILGVGLEDRQPFHRSNPECQKIRDLLGSPAIRSACRVSNGRVGVTCEPPEVYSVAVNDGDKRSSSLHGCSCRKSMSAV